MALKQFAKGSFGLFVRFMGWRPGRPTAGHQELIGLQYIRGLAALMVVVDHVSGMSAFPQFYGRHLLHRIPEAGLAGVDLFFCLSGFIILYVSMKPVPGLIPSVPAWEFLKRRFARIIPFLWIVIALYGILRVASHAGMPDMSYLRAMFLVPVGTVYPPLVWTLRHEFLFYLLFAATFLAWPRMRWGIALWVLSPFIIAKLPTPPIAGFLFNGVNILFGLGVIVGLLFLTRQDTWKLPAWGGFAVFMLAVAVFAVSAAIDYKRIQLMPIVLIGVLSAACLACAAGVRDEKTWLGSLGTLLGNASYSIYLTHPIFVTGVMQMMIKRLPGLSDLSILLIAGIPAVVGGIGLHWVVERPVVSFAKRLMHSRKK